MICRSHRPASVGTNTDSAEANEILVEADGTLVELNGTSVEPNASFVEPNGPSVEPNGTSVEPNGPFVEPNTSSVESSGNSVDFDKSDFAAPPAAPHVEDSRSYLTRPGNRCVYLHRIVTQVRRSRGCTVIWRRKIFVKRASDCSEYTVRAGRSAARGRRNQIGRNQIGTAKSNRDRNQIGTAPEQSNRE